MRHSNQSVRGSRLSVLAVGLVALIAVGCGPAAVVASNSPTPAPTPVITPNPHLTEPVTADVIFQALGSARLPIVGTNASSGNGNPAIVQQINADLGSWPLRIIEYRSSAALHKALNWKPGAAPGGGEAPYAFAGLNVLIRFGPIDVRPPAVPDATRQQAAASIFAALDPLLSPLAERSIVAVPSRTAAPTFTPAPPAQASPKPSPKP